MNINLRILLLILLTPVSGFSQEFKLNEYGLYVINDPDVYNSIIEKDSSKQLVDLEDFIDGIKLDIRYATENNFYGKPVYQKAKAYLRYPAAVALKKVQEELLGNGLALKIFDAYRPYSVTILFYKNYSDSTFVASPWKGSRHNRGCAVDLTIVDIQTNKELEMPTPYDDFTQRAHSEYNNLPDSVILNRNMLIEVMERNGFQVLKDEWWHYDFSEWKNYELMDLSFEELEKIDEERSKIPIENEVE
jgi:D-alanyl-D-alanine dipeptidase